MIRIFAAALVGLAGLTTGALAQAPCEAICKAALDQDVVYAAPINRQSPGAVAGLSVVGGQVLQSAATGMMPIEKEARLSVGDQVMLTEGGQAMLSGPARQAQITGPTVLNVVAAQNCGCITQERVVTLAQEDEEADGQLSTELITGGAVVVGAGALLILLAADDNDDRPRLPDAPVSP